MIKNFVLVMFVMLVLSGSAAAQKVAGAWRLDEATMPGPEGKTAKFSNPNIYLFTKGHFSIIRVEGDKPRSTTPWLEMTRDEVVDTYVKQFTASGGTYELKGDTLTMKTTIAKNPNIMTRGDWISYSVKVNGQTMTLTATATNEGPVKNPHNHDTNPPRITERPRTNCPETPQKRKPASHQPVRRAQTAPSFGSFGPIGVLV